MVQLEYTATKPITEAAAKSLSKHGMLCESDVTLVVGGVTVNGSSIKALSEAPFGPGVAVQICVSGSDEEDAAAGYLKALSETV